MINYFKKYDLLIDPILTISKIYINLYHKLILNNKNSSNRNKCNIIYDYTHLNFFTQNKTYI